MLKSLSEIGLNSEILIVNYIPSKLRVIVQHTKQLLTNVLRECQKVEERS